MRPSNALKARGLLTSSILSSTMPISASISRAFAAWSLVAASRRFACASQARTNMALMRLRYWRVGWSEWSTSSKQVSSFAFGMPLPL
ncbi:MAG: hypothetical protein TEF_21925 [Rhizobiales bacterium NRL2]|nr:MAG: hypothetical protein TEF_21925 [Rhizobiales bacterium NRL2]